MGFAAFAVSWVAGIALTGNTIVAFVIALVIGVAVGKLRAEYKRQLARERAQREQAAFAKRVRDAATIQSEWS